MGVAPRNTLPPFPLTGGGYSGGKSGGHWNVGTSGAPAYMQCRITDTTWLRVRCCSTRRRRGLAAPRPCVMALGCGGAWAATNPVLAPSSSGVSDPRVCSWAHGHRTRGSPPTTTCLDSECKPPVRLGFGLEVSTDGQAPGAVQYRCKGGFHRTTPAGTEWDTCTTSACGHWLRTNLQCAGEPCPLPHRGYLRARTLNVLMWRVSVPPACCISSL